VSVLFTTDKRCALLYSAGQQTRPSGSRRRANSSSYPNSRRTGPIRVRKGGGIGPFGQGHHLPEALRIVTAAELLATLLGLHDPEEREEMAVRRLWRVIDVRATPFAGNGRTLPHDRLVVCSAVRRLGGSSGSGGPAVLCGVWGITCRTRVGKHWNQNVSEVIINMKPLPGVQLVLHSARERKRGDMQPSPCVGAGVKMSAETKQRKRGTTDKLHEYVYQKNTQNIFFETMRGGTSQSEYS
jgi:hypothetical protein